MNSNGDMLNRIAALAEELGLATLRPQIAACHQLLEQGNGLEVAVFGRFKAGKSSFLNHLAGRAVLPIGVVPLTAVITRLRPGPRDRARVQFLDGREQEIALADVPLYVTEHENPHNQRQVATVAIELPELQPYAPLEFVDTPGLGSAFGHNTEAALNWVPHVAVALVAVSSDAPLSERDLALLDELRRHTPKMALLLTKADLLTESQRAEVRAFVAAQLRERWSHAPPIFFYSIRPEHARLKATLQAELLEPLRKRSREAGSEILRHKLASLRDQALSYLRVALAAATQTESARAGLRDRLHEEQRQFDLLRAELHLLPREVAARALDDYLERLRPLQRRLQTQITDELRQHMAEWYMPVPRLVERWRAWLHAWLERALNDVSRSEQVMFCAPVEQTRLHLMRVLRAFQDRLAAHVEAALGVRPVPREIPLEIRLPEAPPLDVSHAFDPAFTSVSWLLPGALIRPAVERALLRKARYEVEKNLSRLAADWRDRVQQAIAGLCQQAEQMARAELDSLQALVARSPSEVTALHERIRLLESLSMDDTVAARGPMILKN